MNIDWTASKVACGLDNKDRRRALAKLLLSLDDPAAYSNADHEIKGQIFSLLQDAAKEGTEHLKGKYGEAVK
jgi:hypothetical protein